MVDRSPLTTPHGSLFSGRFVILHDLDSPDFAPLGVLFEQRDGSARLHIFEDAEARDQHVSKLRREFDDFEAAVATWSRGALISTYGKVGTSLV